MFGTTALCQVQDTDACIRTTTAQHPPTSTHYYESTSLQNLRSASERRLVVPSQRGSKSLSRTFSFNIPGWWNNLPTHIRNAGWIPVNFPATTETHLFSALTWLHPKLVLKKKKKKKKKPFPLSFSPSLASLYLFEQWLRLGVTRTSSVWLPLQDESLYVLPQL